MDPVYVPLLSALAGAVIGSASSIVTILIQSKIGERREMIRQAAALALEDIKISLQHAAPGTGVLPISIYLNRHIAILKAIEEDDLTPERLRKITANDEALIDLTVALDKEFRDKQKRNKPTQ